MLIRKNLRTALASIVFLAAAAAAHAGPSQPESASGTFTKIKGMTPPVCLLKILIKNFNGNEQELSWGPVNSKGSINPQYVYTIAATETSVGGSLTLTSSSMGVNNLSQASFATSPYIYYTIRFPITGSVIANGWIANRC